MIVLHASYHILIAMQDRMSTRWKQLLISSTNQQESEYFVQKKDLSLKTRLVHFSYCEQNCEDNDGPFFHSYVLLNLLMSSVVSSVAIALLLFTSILVIYSFLCLDRFHLVLLLLILYINTNPMLVAGMK